MTGPSNVLLVTVDCLRVDRLQDELEAGHLPAFDRIRSRGLSFSNAFTVANTTDPSLTSMLTGLTPPSHGVLENGWGLPEEIPTIATHLASAGYDTAGVVSVDHLADQHSGLGTGFNRYEDGGSTYDTLYPILSRIYDTKTFNTVFGAIKNRGVAGVTVKDLLRQLGLIRLHERPASRVTGDTVDAINELEPPFFAWTHYFDLHEPRNAPRALRRGRDRYTAALHHVDEQLGALQDALAARDLLEDTLIVVTADHGESLDDHGYTGHGRTLYDEELHVPLFFSHPSLPNERVDTQVRTIDIVPTILALLEEAPLDTDGTALVSPDGTITESDQRLVAQAYPPFGEKYAVRTPSWKFIDDRANDSVELYNLQADPEERTDVSSDEPEVVAELQDAVETWLQRRQAVEDQSVDEATEEMLADLGYID